MSEIMTKIRNTDNISVPYSDYTKCSVISEMSEKITKE